MVWLVWFGLVWLVWLIKPQFKQSNKLAAICCRAHVHQPIDGCVSVLDSVANDASFDAHAIQALVILTLGSLVVQEVQDACRLARQDSHLVKHSLLDRLAFQFAKLFVCILVSLHVCFQLRQVVLNMPDLVGSLDNAGIQVGLHMFQHVFDGGHDTTRLVWLHRQVWLHQVWLVNWSDLDLNLHHMFLVCKYQPADHAYCSYDADADHAYCSYDADDVDDVDADNAGLASGSASAASNFCRSGSEGLSKWHHLN